MIYVVFLKETHPWRRVSSYAFACSTLGPDRENWGRHVLAYVKGRKFKWLKRNR